MKIYDSFAALLLMAWAAAAFAADGSWYDFRATPQYAALSTSEKEKLEQVHRDFVLLWGALDMYADDHGGKSPHTLEALVPRYLVELPRDPFATETSAAKDGPKVRTAAPNGWGYRYCSSSIRAWIISSVGLPRFPYLVKQGNHGLYRGKGNWVPDLDIPFGAQESDHAVLQQYLQRRAR
jgi:hypothetical protein